MNHNIKISKERYTLAMVKVLNCFLNLTDYEMDIIVKMIDNDIRVLTSESRKRVRALTGGKSVQTTNNYIKRLLDKRVLVSKDDEGVVINDNIMQTIEDGEFNVKFNVN